MTPITNKPPHRVHAEGYYHIQVLERAVKIIDQVVFSHQPVLINVLAKDLELHPSTTYRISRALIDLGLLEFDEIGRVIPGLRLLSLGKIAAQSHTLSVKFAPKLQEFAKATQEIVNLGVLRNNAVFYLDKFEPIAPETGLTVRIGQSAPLYCSALGKVFMAGMPREMRTQVIQGQTWVARTPYTITTADALDAEIARTESRGWAEDNEEYVVGIRCIAVPLTVDGRTIAAISITLPKERATGNRWDALRSALRDLAHELSVVGP